MTAHVQRDGDVAFIRLDNPPMNGLSLGLRRAFLSGLQAALADPGVRALILIGSDTAFSSGADITEFGSPMAFQEPNLTTLIDALEHAGKPVVAAISGVAMGGGLELAMGCNARVVVRDTRVAMPEVKLGLIPGAGGTQRLPRALGVEPALNLILSGETVAAEALAAIPSQTLFQRVVDSTTELLPTAVQLAHDLAAATAAGQSLPRLSAQSCRHPQGEAFFQFVRTMVKGQAGSLPAPLKCVDMVEAATQKPFAQGLAAELQTFLALMETPESAAFRHLFMAERATSKIADVPASTPKRAIRRVAVIGAGTMGSGIAINFLNAGLPVYLLDSREDSLARGAAHIRQVFEGQVKKGKLKPEVMAERLSLLRTTTAYADVADADLAIEAVFEDLAVKRSVLQQLDAVLKPGAIIASNTSTLDLNVLAGFTQRPQDVVGLHFFSPANIMKLLEVVRGRHTSREVLATVMALGKTIRKTCVVSGVCDGFIGNRMLNGYFRQAAFLVEEGASPQEVDKAIEAFGFAMGPFRVSDMAGNDIGWAIRKRHYVEKPDVRHSRLPDRVCELGRFGQKTGGGWYDYVPGQRDAKPSPLVADLIDQYRLELGVKPRKIAAEEIVQRLVYALVNEGARILEEGIAARASDIDMVYVTGYGFPVYRGGPMQYAEQQGLFKVVQSLERLAAAPHADASFWQPAALLRRLVDVGQGFDAAAAIALATPATSATEPR